jgi:hypothetical protein
MTIYRIERLQTTATDGGDSFKMFNLWVNDREYDNPDFAKDYYNHIIKDEPKIARRLVQINTVILESHSRA